MIEIDLPQTYIVDNDYFSIKIVLDLLKLMNKQIKTKVSPFSECIINDKVAIMIYSGKLTDEDNKKHYKNYLDMYDVKCVNKI
jgi:hypothetical protein